MSLEKVLPLLLELVNEGSSVFDFYYSKHLIYPTAVALKTYASDPKYKKYVQQVEKCLNSFDNVHEWADCIAFLKQLLKVLCFFKNRIFRTADSF